MLHQDKQEDPDHAEIKRRSLERVEKARTRSLVMRQEREGTISGTIRAFKTWYREIENKLNKEADLETEKKVTSGMAPSEMSSSRQWLMRVFDHPIYNLVMGMIIAFNVMVLAVDSSAQARCITAQLDAEGPEECPPDMVCFYLNVILMTIYTTELLLRFHVLRAKFFTYKSNNADLFIVAGGIVDLLLSSLLPGLQVLKLFRMLRLTRTIRILNLFPELCAMIGGFLNALAAMLWGFMMIVLLLCIWSVVAVETVHPRNVEVDHQGDIFCEEAFGSVDHAIIVFFQTLVAGDSWGRCFIPIITTYPELLPVFCGSFVCIQLGFMNLILSVIVDKSADSREQKKSELQLEKIEKEREAVDRLLEVCGQMDTDNSGTISYDEVLYAYANNSELQDTLDDLSIAEEDLRDLFLLADDDGSGLLTYKEFVKTVQSCLQLDPAVQLITLRMQLNSGLHRIEKVIKDHASTVFPRADELGPDGHGPDGRGNKGTTVVQGSLDIGNVSPSHMTFAAPEQAFVSEVKGTSSGSELQSVVRHDDSHLIEQVQATIEECRKIGVRMDGKFEDLKLQTVKHLSALNESFQQLHIKDVVSETRSYTQSSTGIFSSDASTVKTQGVLHPVAQISSPGADAVMAQVQRPNFAKMQMQMHMPSGTLYDNYQPTSVARPIAKVSESSTSGGVFDNTATEQSPTRTKEVYNELPPSKTFSSRKFSTRDNATSLLQTAEAQGWVCAIASGRHGTSVALPGCGHRPDRNMGETLTGDKQDVPQAARV